MNNPAVAIPNSEMFSAIQVDYNQENMFREFKRRIQEAIIESNQETGFEPEPTVQPRLVAIAFLDSVYAASMTAGANPHWHGYHLTLYLNKAALEFCRELGLDVHKLFEFESIEMVRFDQFPQFFQWIYYGPYPRIACPQSPQGSL